MAVNLKIKNPSFVNSSQSVLNSLGSQLFQHDNGQIKKYTPPEGDNLVLLFKDSLSKGQSQISNITNVGLNSVLSLPRIHDTFQKISQTLRANPNQKFNIADWSKKGLEYELLKAVKDNEVFQKAISNFDNLKNGDISQLLTDKADDFFASVKDSPQAKEIFNTIKDKAKDKLEEIVYEKLNKFKQEKLMVKYQELKQEYGKYYKNLTKQQNMELLGAVLPSLRKKIEELNTGLAHVDEKFKTLNAQQLIQEVKNISIPTASQIKDKVLGGLNLQQQLNTAFSKIWTYKPTQQHIKKIGTFFEKYIPDQNKMAKGGYKMAVDLFAKFVTSDKPFKQILKEKMNFTANDIKDFAEIGLREILPPKIYQAFLETKAIDKIVKNGSQFYKILNSTIPLTKLQYAKLSNLGVLIANQIIQCLPVPEQVKSIFSLAASVTGLICLVASGGSILPILLGLVGVFSSLLDLKMCWNKKNSKNDRGGNDRENGNGNQQRGRHGNKSRKPTVTNVPIHNGNQEYQSLNNQDSNEQIYDKYVRNCAKKMFQVNKMMTAEEARKQQEQEQRRNMNQQYQRYKKQKSQQLQRERGGTNQSTNIFSGSNNSKTQSNNSKGNGGSQYKENSKRGAVDKVSFDAQFWISDYTKNTHQGQKYEKKKVQEKQFTKIQEQSKQLAEHYPIMTEKKMSKKIKLIQIADQLPEKQYDSKLKQKTQIISEGKYFTKQRLKQFDSKIYRKTAKYVKGKDEILTSLPNNEEKKKKDAKTLITFINLNMNKQAGKINEQKQGDKRVLIPDKQFGDGDNDHPELIQEKKNGRINKGIINPNIKGNCTVSTFDFFNSLQIDTTSIIGLVLPSQLVYLSQNDTDIIFYKKYNEKGLLGHERVEQSIEKQQENSRKKAGLAHLSYEELKYKIMGQREQFDEYITGGTYQIASPNLLAVNTNKLYQLSGELRTKHPMRVMIGFICYNSKKELIPGYSVFKKGEFVTFMNYDKKKKEILVEGDLSEWNSFPQNKKLKQRFLGFYLDGNINKNPNFTIICNNDPELQSVQESGFVEVDPKSNLIKLSNYSLQFIPNNLKPKVTKLANQIYENNNPSLICIDIKNIEPSEVFTDINFEITGEGRSIAQNWKNGDVVRSQFWPETAYVQVAIYTNWFDNKKRNEKGELIWRNIHFEEK